ncbi:MAG TPA: bile acid:sodium symporter family protein, partial [Polyangiaceae bacterium]|nr:bile acid:sodium symporter family protein [Polyangiaceae bacterium]
MVLAVLLAWWWPEPGAQGGALHPELTNKVGVALIFLLHGLTLSFQALKAGTLRFKLHLIVQLSTFVGFPCVGLVLVALSRGRVDPALVTGVFFLCALPSTVSSSVALTAAARGNVPAAVFNATLSSLLGVVLTPLWLGLVLGSQGSALPLGKVVLDLCLWLLLPLLVGQLLRPWLGGFAERHKAQISVIDRGTILLLVYTSFCDSVMAGVWAKQGIGTLLYAGGVSAALLALVLAGTAKLSRALGFSEEDRIVAVFCGSKKTLAAGVPMARLIFGADAGLSLILLPLMIYHPLQLVVGGWLAGYWAARPRVSPHTPQV